MNTICGPVAPPASDDGGVSLAIGCFASICRDLLADRLVSFTRKWPMVDLGVHDMPRAELLASVRDGTLALAILPGGPVAGLAYDRLVTDSVIVAAAASHRFAAMAKVPVEELLTERILVPRQRRDGEMQRFLTNQVAPDARIKGMLTSSDRLQILKQIAADAAIALGCESSGEFDYPGVVTRNVTAAGASFAVGLYRRPTAATWPLSAFLDELLPPNRGDNAPGQAS